MGENLIPASAAAQQAGLSSEQIRRRILRGEIKGQQLGGRWFVDTSSLIDWIRQHSQEPSPAA